MSRIPHALIYIDKDPNDRYKGWGWVKIKVEDVRKFNIPTKYPATYWDACRSRSFDRYKFPNSGNLPSVCRASTKQFALNLGKAVVVIRAQKSLTIRAVLAWVATWANHSAKLITPGNRSYALDGIKEANEAHFVYFIWNEDSKAIKIGRAKNLIKRMKALQTSSPARLRLIKSIQVLTVEEAQTLELSLHQQFSEFRLSGEWFRAEDRLMHYIQRMPNQTEAPDSENTSV